MARMNEWMTEGVEYVREFPEATHVLASYSDRNSFHLFSLFFRAHPFLLLTHGKGSDQHPVRAEFLISKRKQLCQGVPLQWIRKRDNDRFLSSQIAKWIIRNDKCLLSTTWPFQYSAELWSRETVEYYCPSLRSRQQLFPFILNPSRVSGDWIKFNERNRNLGLPLKCWRDFIGKEKQRVKDLLYSIKYH